MPDFDVWDVVRIPLPYTNRSVRQHRPGLVIGVLAGEKAPSLLWVLMITSLANRGWPNDVPITGLKTAGLPAASLVRTAKVATIEATDAGRLGTLETPDRRHVVVALRRTLRQAVDLQ